MWELPIWSTSSMKTKPSTSETPMQAWSCSWPCSWPPLALRTVSTSPFASDTSTTPPWPWLWCPPAGGGSRMLEVQADLVTDSTFTVKQHKTNTCVWQSGLCKRNRHQTSELYCMSTFVLFERSWSSCKAAYNPLAYLGVNKRLKHQMIHSIFTLNLFPLPQICCKDQQLTIFSIRIKTELNCSPKIASCFFLVF